MFFRKKKPIVCGGSDRVDIVDRLGRHIAYIHYRKPNSDEILAFVYNNENATGSESKLRELKGTTPNKIHELIVNDVFIPFAEKIFESSEGFNDENGVPIDSYDKDKQFDYLKRFYSHCLVDMVAYAYRYDVRVKKKD